MFGVASNFIQRLSSVLLLILSILAYCVLKPSPLTAAPSPQPQVDLQITALRYDEQKNLYTLSLSISQPGLIQRLLLKVEEEEAGKLILETPFIVGNRSTIVTEVDGRAFVDEREYIIKLEGIDYAEHLILRSDENGSIEPSERSTLASKVFKHTLPKAKPITATVLNVNVDFTNNVMLIDLDISDEDADQINKFEGWVLDKESGARIHEFGPTIFDNKRLYETLPPALITATAPREYELYLLLTTKSDQVIRTEPRGFKPIPPPPPGLWQRLTTGLNNNPTLLASMLVIIICVVGWLVIQNTQVRRDPLLPPRPPISGTTIDEIYRGAPSRQRGVRVSVLQTSHPEDKISKLIAQLPCDIGREGCQVNIPHDAHISRRHARLSLRDGYLYLSDLGSTNGTFIEHTKLPPNQPIRVNELSHIRLGKTTTIKIEQTD